MSQQDIGLIVLRCGLAAVFLWFGVSQLFDSAAWVGWVPEWALNFSLLSPTTIVLLNGALETIAGALLVLNLLTRWVALVLALHMAHLVIEIGLNEIGVRDFGILIGVLALVFLSGEKTRSVVSTA